MKDTSEEHRQVDYLVTIWNELSQRNTSRREDIYIILANMLDLSPSEVLSLPPEQRMPAILKSQSALPLCLLTDGPNGEQDNAQSCRWMPRNIKMPIHLDLGLLQRVADNLGGDFTLDVDRGDCIILRSSSDSEGPDNCILTWSEPVRSVRRVQITLRHLTTTTHVQRHGLGFIFLLHGVGGIYDQTDQVKGTGCILRVREENSRRIIADYENAFRYAVTATTSPEHACEQDLPSITATVVEKRTEIRLHCG